MNFVMRYLLEHSSAGELSLEECLSFLNARLHDRAESTLMALVGLKYVSTKDDPADGKPHIVLLHDGYCYFEKRAADTKSFIRKSILCPIVVTLLTIIVVNLLKSLLPAWLLYLLG